MKDVGFTSGHVLIRQFAITAPDIMAVLFRALLVVGQAAMKVLLWPKISVCS